MKVHDLIRELQAVTDKVKPNSSLGGSKLLEAALNAFNSLPKEEQTQFLKKLKDQIADVKKLEAIYDKCDTASKELLTKSILGKVTYIQKKFLPKYHSAPLPPAAVAKRVKTPTTPPSIVSATSPSLKDDFTTLERTLSEMFLDAVLFPDESDPVFIDYRNAMEILTKLKSRSPENDQNLHNRLQKLNDEIRQLNPLFEFDIICQKIRDLKATI